MDWEEWCSSEFNTAGFRIIGVNVLKDYYVGDEETNLYDIVKKSDKIKEIGRYIIKNSVY